VKTEEDVVDDGKKIALLMKTEEKIVNDGKKRRFLSLLMKKKPSISWWLVNG
jgi:hypothetical protein